MERYRKAEPGHTRGEQRFPLVTEMTLDFGYVGLEPVSKPITRQGLFQFIDRIAVSRSQGIAGLFGDSSDLLVVDPPLRLERPQCAQHHLPQPRGGIVVDKPLAIRLLAERAGVRQRQIDRPQNDVTANPARRRGELTAVKAKPVVARFTVVVHPDTVAVDSDAAVLVEIIGHQAGVSKPAQHFPVAVEHVEYAFDRADPLGGRRVRNDFAVHPAVVRVGRELQRVARSGDGARIQVESGRGAELVLVVQVRAVQAESERPRGPFEYGCEVG